ncbi:hypothetical protein PVAND_015239 [Polypedilum vanderplanki]|uniref:Uncharacterized protein n=1 Tax=Polypedilum vanderplanki TaxID=319348 RepID=A0A9J6BBK6_POLVA|nr:hypothetical protein PVAND_015239 [Polypedilum vanderplanki]
MSLCEIVSALKSATLENLESFYQNLKFRIQKLRFGTTRVTPMFIQFSDFFWCDKFLSKLGYSVLSEVQSSEKLLRNICAYTQIVTAIFTLLMLVSFVRSTLNLMESDNLFVAMENIGFSGGFFLLFLKWFFLLDRNHDRILKVIEKLDEHYPHSGIDQMDLNTELYLG